MSFKNTDAELAPTEVPERHTYPLSPGRLVDLYFRPRRYFSSIRELDHQSALLISSVLMGIAGAMGRIDQKIIQAELGHAAKGWESTASWLLSSWLNYWLVVIAAGATWAVFLWYLGGWWYKKRLLWSGAAAPSSRLARRVYALQELVLAMPTVLLALVQTVLFSNYYEAWRGGRVLEYVDSGVRFLVVLDQLCCSDNHLSTFKNQSANLVSGPSGLALHRGTWRGWNSIRHLHRQCVLTSPPEKGGWDRPTSTAAGRYSAPPRPRFLD